MPYKNYVTNFRGELCFTPNGNLKIKDEPVTPDNEDFGDKYNLDNSFDYDYGSMRKSMSMNDITDLREDLNNMDLRRDENNVEEKHRQPTAVHGLSKTKFVSMAEAIYHYQRDTPGRFHSTRPQRFQLQMPSSRNGPTVPQSPMLRSKTRLRTTHIMSLKEKEEMEFEELKKFKIKANPIPKSVIIGPQNLPEVPKKPATVPEPFKLTEVHKKPIQSPEEVKFKARPAPKHILEKPNVPPKPPVVVTKPVSPKFHYKQSSVNDNNNKCLIYKQKELNKKSDELSEKPVHRHGPVRPEPFSFEKRDEEMKRRREQKIKMFIEEEKRLASMFKAQPLPGAVKKRMQAVSSKGSSSTTSYENKENNFKFEARPPTVLYKDPFKPVLQPIQLIKTSPFELVTEKRATQREKFEQHLKEKELEQERLRLQREEEERKAEEKAKAELRAKLIHHPKPIPVKNPFVPEKSLIPITVPETPKFVRRLKQN